MEAPDRQSLLPPYEGTDNFTSMPCPGFESGTFGVAVGFAIHYTIWSAYWRLLQSNDFLSLLLLMVAKEPIQLINRFHLNQQNVLSHSHLILQCTLDRRNHALSNQRETLKKRSITVFDIKGLLYLNLHMSWKFCQFFLPYVLQRFRYTVWKKHYN